MMSAKVGVKSRSCWIYGARCPGRACLCKQPQVPLIGLHRVYRMPAETRWGAPTMIQWSVRMGAASQIPKPVATAIKKCWPDGIRDGRIVFP